MNERNRTYQASAQGHAHARVGADALEGEFGVGWVRGRVGGGVGGEEGAGGGEELEGCC